MVLKAMHPNLSPILLLPESVGSNAAKGDNDNVASECASVGRFPR